MARRHTSTRGNALATLAFHRRQAYNAFTMVERLKAVGAGGDEQWHTGMCAYWEDKLLKRMSYLKKHGVNMEELRREFAVDYERSKQTP